MKTKQKRLTPTQLLQQKLENVKVQCDNAEECLENLVNYLISDERLKELLLEHLGDAVRDDVRQELIDQLS